MRGSRVRSSSCRTNAFDATESITICAFTTDPTDAPLIRLPVAPEERNGPGAPCRLMIGRLAPVPKAKLGRRVGRLDEEDVPRLNRAIRVILGPAVSPRSREA